MMMKISLALCAGLCTLTAYAQTTPLSAACDTYNGLQVGMSINQVQNSINAQHIASKQVGKMYLWSMPSGYKYTLNFLNNGKPVGFVATSPTRIAFYPATRYSQFSDYYPGPYGTPSLNEKKMVYQAHNKTITLHTAQQLLGDPGTVIGQVYQFKWPDNKVLTVDTDLNGNVHDFSVNAYCGSPIPQKYIF